MSSASQLKPSWNRVGTESAAEIPSEAEDSIEHNEVENSEGETASKVEDEQNEDENLVETESRAKILSEAEDAIEHNDAEKSEAETASDETRFA